MTWTIAVNIATALLASLALWRVLRSDNARDERRTMALERSSSALMIIANELTVNHRVGAAEARPSDDETADDDEIYGKLGVALVLHARGALNDADYARTREHLLGRLNLVYEPGREDAAAKDARDSPR
jgi:hypothetical protein